MKTAVLDDDPTGTQSASDVEVLLDWDVDTLETALRRDDAVYLQTNSRAIAEEEARALAGRIRDQLAEVERRLGEPVQVVLRGDSTLRGHVFAESDVFADADSVLLFVPAFPQGGRTTVDGVHLVRVGDARVPAGETEYARDPVFGYRSSRLVDYVRERGRRAASGLPLADLRATGGAALADLLRTADRGTVLVPDAETDDDIRLIHAGLLDAVRAGRRVVVRSGAPLAAVIAGRASTGLLQPPLGRETGATLVVCGSHTSGATAQLSRVVEDFGAEPVAIGTDRAFADPSAEGHAAGSVLADRLRGDAALAVLSTERVRRAEDNTLEHGERVMRALTTAVSDCADRVGVIVSKGGITSAEVAREALGARSARVRGQVVPGVSVWDLEGRTRRHTLIVVPGNVGDADTLTTVLRALGDASTVPTAHPSP
jgi:uncharacterized protein YgbK (DUF1537 family)